MGVQQVLGVVGRHPDIGSTPSVVAVCAESQRMVTERTAVQLASIVGVQWYAVESLDRV